MQSAHQEHLPAAGHAWLLPLYDPVVKLLGGDAARRVLIGQARLQPGHRVLEIGCGTGTLAAMIKRHHPEVEVVGIDPDPQALARARRKAARETGTIQFTLGFAGALPYPASSFDRVFSFLVYHHLPSGEKAKMLREARRVLRAGGEFHMADLAGPEEGSGFVARLFHSRQTLQENSAVRVVALMNQAGFRSASQLGRRNMLLGKMVYYCASA